MPQTAGRPRRNRTQQNRPRTRRQRRHTRQPDGLYHIGDDKYHELEGSRAQVKYQDDNGIWSAYRTRGGLTRKDLKYNPQGRIVSVARSRRARQNRNLGNHLQPKGSGTFGSANN